MSKMMILPIFTDEKKKKLNDLPRVTQLSFVLTLVTWEYNIV